MKRSLVAFGVSLACLLAGCSNLQKMTPSYRHAKQRTHTLEQLQLTTLRFSDEYCTRVYEGATRFQATARTPEERLQAQKWKSTQCESIYIDAGGPNPALNTIDIVVLATLSRMVVDDAWTIYGERVELLRRTQHELEGAAWQLSKPVLSDAQTAQLHGIIDRWRAQNPSVHYVGAIHFTDFAKSIGEPGPAEESQADSIFSIVNLNPFAELDPAVAEIAQSRQLAERAVFYFQRLPNILDMQAESFPYQMAIQPETKQLLASLQRASLIGSAANSFTTDLPSILDREREALLRQLTLEITSQSASIGELSSNLRSTLEAGTATAKALNAVVQNLNTLTETSAQRGSPPFDIRNYTEALRSATVTAEQLAALTQQLNNAAPALRSATQGLIDNIVRQILLVLTALILGTLGAAIAYRLIVFRLQRLAA